MAEAFDQIGAPVPVRRLGRIGLELALLEEQRAPSDDQRAVVEGKLQIVRRFTLLHRRDRAQVSVDRVAVLARHLGVGGKRHRRIDQPAVGETPVVHHLVELVGRPHADAGLRIGRDVGGVERAERRLHRQAAGKGLAFARGVTGDAVAGAGEIFALGEQAPHPAPPPATRRSAATMTSKAGSRAFKVLGICAISLQFGSLPQASGIGRLPRLAKDGSVGAGTRRQKGRDGLDVVFGQEAGDDLHAVGRRRGPRAVAPAAELRADVAGAQAEQTRVSPAPCRQSVEPWQLAQAGMPRCGSPLVTIDSPRARISLLTVGTAGAGNGGRNEAKCSAICFR